MMFNALATGARHPTLIALYNPERDADRPESYCRSVFLLRCHEVTTDGGGGMISHFINEPDHWRARSEEVRNLANQMNDPESKDAMLRIADDYERLANRAENRAAGRLPNWMKPKGAIQ
jgi:hypothetical protein